MNRKTGRTDWLELAVGILLILLGLFTFVSPGSILTGLVMIYGVIAMITGIADIVLYVKVGRHMGLGPTVSLVAGVFSVMVGVMLLIYPGTAEWVISIMLPVWFIAHCVSRLAHIGMLRKEMGKGFAVSMAVLNAAGLLLGVAMLLDPVLSLISLGYIIGFCLIFLGAESVARAFERRKYL